MGQLIFYGAISLDGYLAGVDDDLSWLLTTPEGDGSTYPAFYKTIGITAMGRRTYEASKYYLKDDLLYPDKENYVFSRQPRLQLPDAKVIHDDPAVFLARLKATRSEAIWLVGGGQLLKVATQANLVDQWIIQIAPVLLGQGIPLFQDTSYQQRLKLTVVNRFGEFAELRYIVPK